MSLPKFTDIQKINELHKQIAEVQEQIRQTEEQLEAVKKEYERKAQNYRTKTYSSRQQQLILEEIERELKELREQESQIKKDLLAESDETIKNFFQDGTFAKFVADLLSQVKKTEEQVTVRAGSEAQKFVPDQEFESAEEPNLLRLDVGYKDYVLDLDKLHEMLQERLLWKKLQA